MEPSKRIRQKVARRSRCSWTNCRIPGSAIRWAGDYCVIRGIISPGVSVPIHSHPDDESLFLCSGFVQALEQHEDKFEWINMDAGDFRHVPHGVKHAWKTKRTHLRSQSL